MKSGLRWRDWNARGGGPDATSRRGGNDPKAPGVRDTSDFEARDVFGAGNHVKPTSRCLGRNVYVRETEPRGKYPVAAEMT